MPRPILTLLTDFGLKDHYVAAVKGVILGICPDATLIDISHEIEAYDIRQAAWTLSQAWEWFPPGTVHLVVVDPGVGSERRALAAHSRGHFFVAPDNGVLAGVLSTDPECSVHELTASAYFNPKVSGTFHGRDLFGPAAAHLAAGTRLSAMGPRIHDYLVPEQRPAVNDGPGSWVGSVVSIDRFGNIVTNFDWESFHWVGNRPFRLRIGSQTVAVYRANYSESVSDEYFVTLGSAGLLEISMRGRSAAQSASVKAGIPLQIQQL